MAPGYLTAIMVLGYELKPAVVGEGAATTAKRSEDKVAIIQIQLHPDRCFEEHLQGGYREAELHQGRVLDQLHLGLLQGLPAET